MRENYEMYEMIVSMFDSRFYRSLYQEHIEEIAFCLQQRIEYFEDDAIKWFEVKELENRLLLLVDSFEAGGNDAVNLAKDCLLGGDEDEILGASFALGFSNPDQSEDFLVLFDCLEKEEEFHYLYCIALNYARNINLPKELITLLQHENAHLREMAVKVIAYHCKTDSRQIWPLLHDKDEAVRIAAMNAVMQLGFKDVVPAMEQAVLENKEIFSEHCVFPLLMLGSKKAMQFCRLACQKANYIKPQYLVYIALGGNENDLISILRALEFGGMNSTMLEALGIFGSLKGVNTLMKFLSSENDEEKLTAAKSLNQISGALLYETLSVSKLEKADIDVEDITGRPAASGEDSKSGVVASVGSIESVEIVEIRQDCTDKHRWTQWWQENKGRFDQTIRYRHGKPYSFFLCLEEIAHPETNYKNRQRAYNELVMRSGQHIPFEPDWFVDKQIEALKEWQRWWNQHKGSLNNQWMFDGA